MKPRALQEVLPPAPNPPLLSDLDLVLLALGEVGLVERRERLEMGVGAAVVVDDVSELHVVGSMHERKLLMTDLADGFVALPGGAGTLEELFETFTWLQLGLHDKPIGLLDVAGFWGPLAGLLDHLVAEGFLGRASADRLLCDDDPGRLLDRLVRSAP